MPQKLGVLPGVDVNFHNRAMYESGKGRQVNSKAFSVKHMITH